MIRKHPRLSLIAGILMIAIAAIAVWLLGDLPSLSPDSFSVAQRSILITDRNGRLLYEVIGEEGARHSPVPLSDVPQACIEATIATEDARFYSNPGVDAGAILRALWGNIRGGEVLSGASTITQQVVKNLLLSEAEGAERTLRRKLREAILAIRLTDQLSKDEILALYLNQTDYGNLAIGIDAAARATFGKGVESLDLAECALLAGLPQSPTAYDPLTNPEAAHDRQAVVLSLMAEEGYITQQEERQAQDEPLAFASERFAIEAPHFVMAVIDALPGVLPAETLAAGGFTVRTTLDLDWQHAAETIIDAQLERLNHPLDPAEPPHHVNNAALVAMDPHTGSVLAMVGSPDYFDPAISGAINLALAPRQPGSTLKPFTYAISFDPARPNPWTPATMLLDVRTTFQTHDGLPYTPVNYDQKEHGPVLIREALASSYNIPAVIALDHVGVIELLRFMGRLGMSDLPNYDAVDLSLTLGGGEVRLMELTAGYGAFANGGYRLTPQMIIAITDGDNALVYEGSSGLGERVMDGRVAYLISDILSDNEARAPSFTTHSLLQIGRPAAVKTGTTTDFRDNWTVGYTPNLVVGAWVGNADNSSMIETTGISGAGPIWHDFMRAVLQGRPVLAFEEPEGLVRMPVCALSGLLPSPDCPATRMEVFIAGTEPTIEDTLYQVVTDPRSGRQILTLNLPPQAHDWARAQGFLITSELTALFADIDDPGFMLVAPDQNAIYRIDASRPLDAQKLRFAVSTTLPVIQVSFILDGAVYAIDSDAPYEALYLLQAGSHTLQARGLLADGSEVMSDVIDFTVNAP